MSSAEKKKIYLKDALKDAAMSSAPSFPDFADVYRKAEQRPRKVRRIAFSAAITAVAAAASFWIGIAWNSQTSRDIALIDSWTVSAAPVAVSVSTTQGAQNEIVLTAYQTSPVNLFVQELWESSAGTGL